MRIARCRVSILIRKGIPVRARKASPLADTGWLGDYPQRWGMSPTDITLTCPIRAGPGTEKPVKTMRRLSGPGLAHNRAMKIQMNRPRKIALGVLATLLTLALWPEKDQPVAAPREAAPAAQAAAPREPVARIESLAARDAMPQLARDPFSAEPPKKPVRTVVVSAPAVPVNPYRFAGELRVGGAIQRFLARGDDTFEAKAGEELGDGYAVESVSASAIVLVHRASGTRQALAVGAPAWEDPARARVMQAAQPAAPVAAAVRPGEAMHLDALSGNLPQGFFVDLGGPQPARGAGAG
jgi:hypothetical protein